MNKIKVLQWNIRHWGNNHYQFKVALSDLNPDIILLNEISLNNNDHIYLKGYDTIFNCNGHHTGVSISIKKHLIVEYLSHLSPDILSIKIKTSLGDLIISTIYNPPRFPSLPTVDISKIFSYNCPVVLIGDLNASHPILHNSRNPNLRGNQIHTIMSHKNLKFLGPFFHTYITSTQKGKPDIIISNQQFNLFHYQIEPVKPLGSDHIPILFTIQTTPIKKLHPPKIQFNKINKSLFQNSLLSHQFQPLNNKPIQEIDSELNFLSTNIYNQGVDASPKHNIKIFRNYLTTPQIKLKLKQYQQAYFSWCEFGYPSIHIINKYKNELITLISNTYNHVWDRAVNLASENFGNPSMFWKKFNSLYNTPTPPFTQINNTYIVDESEDSDFGEEVTIPLTNPQDQANFFSQKWSSIFRPNSGNNANTRYVSNWFNVNKINFEHDNIINFDNLPVDHPILRPITLEEFLAVIKTINNNKSPGPDRIPGSLLKILPENYNKRVVELYNSTLASKYWPSASKTSNTKFIPKPSKNLKDPLNFRPISLLNNLAKIFEKIITERLMYFLEYNNFFSENQFGFRKHRSTQQALFVINEILLNNKNDGRVSLLITRDTQKAFDTVWHEGLIFKLSTQAKLDNDTVALFYNYLIDRKMIPFFNNKEGPPIYPSAGVPQGSCLGPELYLINVNDLSTCLFRDSFQTQFADDLIKIVRSDFSSSPNNRLTNVLRKAKKELELTLSWELKWKIKSNPNKSKVIPFGCYKQTLEDLGGLVAHNHHYEISLSTKILGYTITPRLTPSQHISNISGYASETLNKLIIFKNAPIKIKKVLYNALVLPLLLYPSLLFQNINKTSANKLQVVQNKATNFILGLNSNSRITSENRHLQLKMPTINSRLNKINKKCIYKLKSLQLPSPDDPNSFLYSPCNFFSDFELSDPPFKTKSNTLIQKFLNTIHIHDPDKPFILHNIPNNPDDWTVPDPIYVYH